MGGGLRPPVLCYGNQPDKTSQPFNVENGPIAAGVGDVPPEDDSQ